MKAVDILGGVNGRQNRLSVNMVCQRELHENAVDVRSEFSPSISVSFGSFRRQLVFSFSCRLR